MSIRRKRAGARKGAGRPPGSVNRSTAETRALSMAYWAGVARRAYDHELRMLAQLPANQRQARRRQMGPRPPADNLTACVNYLNSLDQAVIATALTAGDHKTVHEVVEHARDRCFGRVKYEVENSGTIQTETTHTHGPIEHVFTLGEPAKRAEPKGPDPET